MNESCRLEGMAKGGSGPSRRQVSASSVSSPDSSTRLGKLLDKQRNAVGLGDDLAQHFLGQRLAAREITDQAGAGARAQAVHGKTGDVSERAPGRYKFRPVRYHQQHAEVAEPIREQGKQLLCRRVDPLRVLDEDAQRLVGCGSKQDVPQQGERFGLDAARSRISGRGIRQSERGSQQRDGVLRLACVAEQSDEMRAQQRSRIVMAKPGVSFDVAQHGMERAVRMIGRALQPDFAVRFRRYTREHRFAEARFAEAGLAGQQKELTLARDRQLPAVQQQREFGIAADQGGGCGVASGAETAGIIVDSEHLPRRNGSADPLKRQRFGRFQIEPIGDECARAWRQR